MLLYPQSLYVALKGLWRFLVVVPFVVPLVAIFTVSLGIGVVVMGGLFGAPLAAAVLSGTLASGADVAGVLGAAATGIGIIFMAFIVVAWAFVMTGFNFVGLVAIRTALMAQGEFNPVEIGRLVKNSIKYAFFFVLAYVAIASLLIFIGFILTELGLSDLPPRFWEKGEAGAAMFANSLMAKILMGIYAVFFVSLNAAMMVPMAAAAWSSTEKMQRLDMFWGIGSAIIVMLLVAITGYVVQYIFGIGAKNVQLFSYLIGVGYAGLTQNNLPQMTWVQMQPLLIAFGISIALYYWQYVAAALAFLKRREALEAARIAATQRPKSDWIDPNELRKARQGQASIFH
jgi:hypothetical protein